MTIKEAYKTMQGKCGIKVGDKVKVLRPTKQGEMGWDVGACWDEKNAKLVGEICEVTAEGTDCAGIELYHKTHSFTRVPFYVLKVVESVAKIEVKYFCDGKDVTNNISDETKRNLTV